MTYPPNQPFPGSDPNQPGGSPYAPPSAAGGSPYAQQPGNPYAQPGNPYAQPGNPYAQPGNPYAQPGNPYAQPGNPYVQQPGNPYAQPGGAPFGPGGAAGAPPSNNIGWAIAAIIVCWPFAIPAFIASGKVDSLWQQGDYAGSQKASADAKKWGSLGVYIGIGLAVLGCLCGIGIPLLTAVSGS